MTDDSAAKKAKTLWLRTKTEFTGNWHIDLDDQAIIVNAFGAELAKAYAEIERFKTMSTVEMMCENLNVKHHVEEWERRCLKAEAEIGRLRAELETANEQIHAAAESRNNLARYAESGKSEDLHVPMSSPEWTVRDVIANLRIELASIEQFAESWPCHCAENYPGAIMYHGRDCQTAIAIEFVAQWRAAKVKP